MIPTTEILPNSSEGDGSGEFKCVEPAFRARQHRTWNDAMICWRGGRTIESDLRQLRFKFSILRFQVSYYFAIRRMKFRHFCEMLPIKIKLRLLYLYCEFVYWEGQLTNFAIRDAILKFFNKCDQFGKWIHRMFRSVFTER